MAANEIKIIIGGDTTQLTTAMRKAKDELGPFTNLTNQTSSSLRKIAVDGNQAAEGFKKVAKSAEHIIPEGSIEEARASVKRLKSELSSLSDTARNSAAGKFLATELRVATSELKAMEVQAGLTSAKTGNFLNTAYGGLRRLAQLIPGIGIGGLIGLIVEPLVDGVKNLLGFSEAAKKSKEESQKFAESLKSVGRVQGEATASVQGEITRVQALAAIVSDANRPYEERNRALQLLRETNKNYLGDLKLEDAVTGKLSETIRQYTDALINSAIQKQFVSEIADVAKRISDSDDIIEKSRDKLISSEAEHEQSQARVAQLRKQLASADSRDIGKINKQIREELQKSSDAFFAEQEARKGLNKANDESTKLIEQELLLKNKLNTATIEGLKFKDLQTQSSKKEEDALKKRLEALEKIQQATKDATSRVGLQEAIFDLQVKITLRDAGKNKLSKDEVDKAILGFKQQLQKEFLQQAIELEAIPKVKFSQVIRAEIPTGEIKSEVAKAAGLDKNIPIDSIFEINVRFFGFKFANKVEAQKRAKLELQEAVNSITKGVTIDAIAGIGEGIGDAISGGGSVFKSLFEVLASGLQQLGRALIAYGLALKGFKLAIRSLNPTVAIIAGIAAVAAGTAIKASLPKFAEGGIATRATVGIFGEAGKEAIIPLDKLPDILGRLNFSNQAPIILQPSLSFSLTDMQIRLERVTDRRRRLG